MKLFNRKKKNTSLCEKDVPVHIGIIMDGNGRWAKKRKLPRSAGHVAGARTFRKITLHCKSIGVKFLTVYAFSTENWKRPKDEVDSLMNLFKQYLVEALRDFQDENIKVKFIGDTSAFSSDLQKLIKEVENSSKDKTGMTLLIAMNYGGRDEIVHACKSIAQEIENNVISSKDITAEMISSHLYTSDIPDPDLIIRPSGEHRTSNFLLWQSAYSEYVIMDILWPDFTTDDLNKAVENFSQRNRRFGGV